MALIVQKFGGSSVSNLECIRDVAKKIIATRAKGHDVVVVVSAMEGETDRLIELAKAIHEQPHPREYAVLVSTGEQISIALLTLALIEQGCPARSYTGAQANIKTNGHHKKARILSIDDQTLREDIASGYVPVVAGFQGVSAEGDITTLGRGGSDTTAVALAAILQADECQIYTDVDGIYTADPRIVPQARRLEKISFEEMFEFASQGAKVLHPRSVGLAGKYKVPLRVLSTFEDGPGTVISFSEYGIEQPIITGIASNRQEVKLSLCNLPNKLDVLAKIFTALGTEQIDIDMLMQQAISPQQVNLTFTIPKDDHLKALSILEEISHQDNNKCEIISDTKIAKLSLIGVGLRSHPVIISTLFNSLGAEKIPVQLISTSEIKVSVVIDENNLVSGLQTLHTAFGLGNRGQDGE